MKITVKADSTAFALNQVGLDIRLLATDHNRPVSKIAIKNKTIGCI